MLNCSSAVLNHLYTTFPGSAQKLSKEVGVCQGPRPVFFKAHGEGQLEALLQYAPQLAVLCPDHHVPRLSPDIEESCNLLLGIRESKGLEFSDVMVLDFFRTLDARDHKAWKHLLQPTEASLAAAGGDTPFQYQHPQVETQLKLLYTAITRSCNRLG